MTINLATIDFCPGQGGGGAAVWGGITGNINSQTDLNAQFVKKTELRTINNESLVGSGNIEVGGLDPEQEAAVDILTDSSEGLLYTEVYDSMSVTNKPNNEISEIDKLNVAGDDIYMHNYSLLKFNKDTLEFEKIVQMNAVYGQNFWKDSTGRLYDDSYIVDITTGAETYKDDMNMVDYYYTGGKTNIFNGQYGTWIIGNTLSKFNETNQVFESGYTINLPQDYTGIVSDFPYKFKYQGHILFQVNGLNKTYELKEYEDHIDVTDVTDVYFKLPVDWTINYQKIFSTEDGNLFHMEENRYYKYDPVNETWESFSIVGDNVYYFNNHYGISGNFMVGGIYSNQSYYITNLGDTVSLTKWTKPSNVAVDLDSSQIINGYKDFRNGASINVLSGLSGLNAMPDNEFRLNKNKTIATRIDINCPAVLLNNNAIVTTDLLIANDTKFTYGPYIKTYVSSGNPAPYLTSYFKTHTGRIFFINGGDRYEWNGSGFANPTSSFVSVTNEYGCRVIVTPNNTFYYDVSNNVYLWNDTSSDFELINQNNSSPAIWGCWWDGTNLRHSGNILVNNNNTWEWVSDPIQDYVGGMYHYVNGDVYVLGDDNFVYKYDPTDKSYERLGYYNRWAITSFVAGGDIIFPYNDAEYRKIDFSKIIPSRDNYIDTSTSIPYSIEYYNYMKYEYNGELLYANFGGIYSCYDINYEKPAVPQADGTYVLKATVVNGQVTYSWVADV